MKEKQTYQKKAHQSCDLLERLEKVELHFIITFGRSGSTLLQAMLNRHPNILATLEQQFFLVNYKYFHSKKNWQDSDIKLFVKNIWLRKKDMAYLWKIDESSLIDQLKALRTNNKLNYQNACKLVYMNHQQFNENTKIIIDKNPIYLAHTDKILKIFPKTKIILLLRDYRGFYASITNYHSKPFKSNFAYLTTWKIGAKRLIKQLSKDKTNHLFLKYEDLITQPENKLRAISSYLSVEFSPLMLDYQVNDSFNSKKLITKRDAFQKTIKKNHRNLNKPLIGSNEQKWKSQLSRKEIQTLELILGKQGTVFNYLPSQKISIFQKYLFYISKAPSLIFSYLKSYIFIDLIYLLPFSIHRFIIQKGNQIIEARKE